MKKGFTLVELIFVIVIIGILAAAAIPQFQNLKQSAEANNVVKATVDSASSAASAGVNLADLEDINISIKGLVGLVQLNGKGWKYITTLNDGAYEYRDTTSNALISRISLNGRTIEYGVTCSSFSDASTKAKCEKAWTLAPTAPIGSATQPIILNF